MSRVYDQWLDSRKHDSDEFMHEFEMRTERYLQTEWNSQDPEVFTEVLYEVDLTPWKTELAEAIKKGSLGAVAIGVIICDAVHNYCEDKAKQKAKLDMEQS
jgi:hypothetical protein